VLVNSEGNDLQVQFTDPVRAVGMDLYSYRSARNTYDIDILLEGGQVLQTSRYVDSSGVVAEPSFFGVSSPSWPIERLIVNTPGIEVVCFDNVVFEPIPEPSTFILVALGMLGFAFFGCRQKR